MMSDEYPLWEWGSMCHLWDNVALWVALTDLDHAAQDALDEAFAYYVDRVT